MAKGKQQPIDIQTKNKNKKVKFEESSSSEEVDQEDLFEENEQSDSQIDSQSDGESENEEESENEMETGDEDDYEDEEENSDQEEEDDEEDEEGEEGEEKEEKSNKKTSKDDGFRDAIRSELNSMTFEQIQQLQNKLGLKKFKEVMQEKPGKNESEKPKVFSRLNKNRPQELSSKKTVSVFRNVFQVKKKEFIDPRFNPAIGEYKPEVFRKSYGFVNDMRKNEKEMLIEELKNEEDPVRREQLKTALTRLKQQINSFKESEKKEEFKSKFKKIANEDAKEGKKPHFVNKSEQKILELAEKYKELKKNGKIEKFLAKKRKKQLSKDKKSFGNNTKHLRFV